MNQIPRSEAVMEVLPLFFDGEQVVLALLGDAPMQVGWHAAVHPNVVAVDLCREFRLQPLVVHSTSWRHEPGRLIVTYAAIVDLPDGLAPMLRLQPLGRRELARGDAVRPPPVIDLAQVAEHALRHMFWLVGDDEQIRASLPPAWLGVLQAYPAEPFRSFESGWA